MSKSTPIRQQGFTLMELVTVIVVLGILSAYAVMKGFSVADVTLLSQAQSLATDLRHAQALASSQGRTLCFMTGNANYFVNVPTLTVVNGASVMTCNAAQPKITNPATGSAFEVALDKGVTFSAVPNPSLTFNSRGQPNAAASYTLSSGTSTNTVLVEATTGKVTP